MSKNDHRSQSRSGRKKSHQQKFAKKELGQNFLQDTNVRDRILDAAGDIHEKNVLEIGPGLGFLTSHLLKNQCHLTAVEFDERAVNFLKKDLGERDNFNLRFESILDTDLDEMFENKSWQCVANIPYHITAPILRKLLAETNNRPTSCVLMIQKEVAEKICRTRCGKEKITEHRSILQISVEIFATAENLFEVPREAFVPSPKINSAVMRLVARPEPLVSPEMERDFFTIVNAGFSERRKKLRNSLQKFFGTDPTPLLGTIDGDRRAETLDIAEWLTITENFRKSDFN